MKLKIFTFKIFGNWDSSSEALFIGTALIVGLGTGLGAVAFRYLIQGVEWVGYDWFPVITAGWGKAYVLIIPAIGGLIVGPLVYFFAREAKGHGVPEVMEAVALRGGRIRPIVAVVKSLASAISIGSGGSVGREGPIVQIGSALGSSLGQKLGLSDDRIRNLVACGAAGGIAATFNAPIAGVVFALEIILGEFSVKYFSSVVVSAVTASVIGRAVFGDIPAFHIPIDYGINSLWEFAFYPVLGLAAAIVGAGFVYLLYWSEDVFDNWKSVPEWVQPAIGGVLLGVVALSYPALTGITWDRMPQVYNVGYEIIESALANQLALGAVLILLVLKMIVTSLTLGSGGSGGVFAPALFMGAMFGTAFELVVNMLFPGVAAPPGAYALVGMAALFAATAHAPLTAVLILFELTGDYKIMLPLMFTVVIATLFAQKLLKGESIYSLKLTRRGVRIQHGRDVDVLQGVLVNEVMTRDIHTITKDVNLKGLSRVFNKTRHHGIAILDGQGKLWGMVTISDLEYAIHNGKALSITTVGEIGTPYEKLSMIYPDESIGDALNKMSRRGFGRLPVISRDDSRHLLGLVQRRDIVESYQLARTKRAEIQHRAQRMKIRNIDGTEFVELVLKENSPATGKTVGEIASALPHECILISIRREGNMLIPHGETELQTGDQLTAFIRSEDVEELYKSLSRREEETQEND
ncbi:MAG: CBS domain-containing protein [Anaerolineae bacterium]|nr:CBS domain-containing protein [Anaerolineae bacterium]MBT4311724.1 CBS domain-containing protein [Anaerolineae bacterium]MBT4459133.1 CBS domain-containing protein [Anaerolineae bacterium]MBT4840904.1 CBS domain-containing protein [Anaerolineae bacterium]MBT6060726.1 CBS domain-containing protein [Anaerolineae bacterium]